MSTHSDKPAWKKKSNSELAADALFTTLNKEFVLLRDKLKVLYHEDETTIILLDDSSLQIAKSLSYIFKQTHANLKNREMTCVEKLNDLFSLHKVLNHFLHVYEHNPAPSGQAVELKKILESAINLLDMEQLRGMEAGIAAGS